MKIRQECERLRGQWIDRHQPDRVGDDGSVGVIGQLNFHCRTVLGENSNALPGPTPQGGPIGRQTLIKAYRLTDVSQCAIGAELLNDNGEGSVARVRVITRPGNQHLVRPGSKIGELPGCSSGGRGAAARVEAVVVTEERGGGTEIALPAGRES